MANKVTLTATDGSIVEFFDEIKAQGGVKDVYFSTDKTYVVAFYRKPINANDKARINDIVNTHRNRIFTADAIGQYWNAFFAWPTKIVEWKGLTGIVIPFYDKKFFFSGVADSWPFIKNGQEKNGKWFSSAKLINKFVPVEQKGTFLTRLHMCLKIARAMRRLHAAGLAHSDLSYNNVLVDPLSGNACIIDCDGLVVPHKFPPEVVGTPGFIAPEVLATKTLKVDDPKKNLPQISTDRHALAVLIYTFLLNRHPLDGGKVWDIDDPQKDDDMRYGSKALFIEHPTDKTNRVKPDQLAKSQLPQGDPTKMPYTICGPYLKKLFDRAFIDGLHNPSVRPSAAEWEDALVKTCDLVQPCQNLNCEAHWYVFDNTTKPRCPFCGKEYKGQLPILNFYYAPSHGKYISENYRLMVYDKQTLYKWHSNNLVSANEKTSAEDKRPVGDFHFHNGQWILINRRLPDMKDITDGKNVPIGGFVPQTSCEGYSKKGINLDKKEDSSIMSDSAFHQPKGNNSNTNSTTLIPQEFGMFSHPFSFKGRIRRLEFGISLIIFTIWAIIVNIAAEDPDIEGGSAILLLLSYIPALWFYWAQLCKRFHDRGCSGTYIFFLLIPIYNLYLICMQIFADGDKFENEYGPDPKGRN